MPNILSERFRQRYRTLDAYPRVDPKLSDRFLGRPVITRHNCGTCRACLDVCPTKALQIDENGPRLDMGRCLFCGACAAACKANVITFSGEHRVCTFAREDLVVSAALHTPHPPRADAAMFARSLKLREVSAGGCNACEADTNVLGTLVYDLGRFGIDFVASPRHADGLVVTGPVTHNMRAALLDTYEAMPEPRLVIAVGSCAISGGLFREGGDDCTGLENLLHVDAFIPGCPPNPWSILNGLLALTGRA